ncbi:hypothetical protein R3W88_032694 [Solanum pinnatisectum]|uniref:Serine hydroxymethyltransferase-like domain-containing protein n=1 Tax=Solanum pinnatisectum TaxID=50273 RepID=A0AAV9LPV9_9SOLN|nr:hypothetical protein R3W88_032694 [Solanum pinnatisectum]
MQKLDENFSYILCKLDNVQRALSTYSQSVIADPMPPDMDSSYEDNGDLALSFDDSSLVFEDLVATDTDTVDECIQPSLQVCVVQTHTQVLLSDLLFDLNDGTLEEVTGGTLEEVSGISTYKVFTEIPDRDIDMEVVDSIKNDVVTFETQVFDERFHTIYTVGYDFSNLVKFDEMSFALLCMLLDCSSNDGIFAYLSELDPTKRSLSLYRFPPAQFKLEFPFDPGSSQFPYDPGANVFIVTSSGSLQVHQLHPAIFVFKLLLVMDTFQLFGSVFYIRPTVKLAKPIIDNESFWAITGSRHSVEVLRVFEAIKNNWSFEIGVETFNAVYFDRCLWVTEHIRDHLDYSCMEYKCGIPVKEFHTCDAKVEIYEFIYQLRVVRRQNKWMMLSSPYFVCNILMKALYSLSPNDDFECYITIQLVSYSLPGFVVSSTFANRPFDLVCGLRRKHVGTTASEQVINILELLLALYLVGLDASTGYSDCKQLEICDTLFRTKLIATNASASARRYDYARLGKVCSKQKVYLLADMAHISGLVASLVICSPFKYSTFVPIATQFMGAKVYTTIVFGKSLFSLEGCSNEQTIFYIVSRLVVVAGSIKDSILCFANIAQLVLATIGRECATNIVLGSNLDDTVLIGAEGIVMNGPRPLLAKKPNTRLSGYVWDPG